MANIQGSYSNTDDINISGESNITATRLAVNTDIIETASVNVSGPVAISGRLDVVGPISSVGRFNSTVGYFLNGVEIPSTNEMIYAEYSSNTLLPNSNTSPNFICLNFTTGFFYVALPLVTTISIGKEFTFFLKRPLVGTETIVVQGRTATQLIQATNTSLSINIDFKAYMSSITVVCISNTPSSINACWAVTNYNFPYDNMFVNRKLSGFYNENYVENNWHALNYFDRPEAEGSALGIAIGSVLELNGNIYTGGRTLTPEDLSYPASSRQKITLVGNYLATNLSFLDAGILQVDDTLPSPPTQIYLPEIIDSNDFGKHFTIYLRGGTGIEVEILTSAGQQITYLNQTGLTSVFMNGTGNYTNILTFYAIQDGSTDNWFLSDNQRDLSLSNNTYSGHNYFSGEVDFQNTINANALTISPTQLSYLNLVSSNQVPQTAVSGLSTFITEFNTYVDFVAVIGGDVMNLINCNPTLTAGYYLDIRSAGIRTTTATITDSQVGFLSEVASNKIPTSAINANLCTTDTAQTISNVKTFTSNPILNAAALPITAISGSSNITLNNTTSTISAVKTFSSNPSFNIDGIPTRSVADMETRYPTTVREITLVGYLAGNAITTTTTTATNICAIGDGALQLNSSGNFVTAVGSGAGQNHDTGTNCVYVGYNSGNLNTASNVTICGSGSCNTQASIPNATVCGTNNQITTGVSNAFCFGYNNTVTANGAGCLGNNINCTVANQVELGAGINTIWVNGSFVTNGQYINEAGPVITGAITIPNAYFYQYYAIRNSATAFTVRTPSAVAGRVGTTLEFRRVLGSTLTTIISFDCVSGNVMYPNASVTGAATVTMPSGSTRIKMICLSDGQVSPAFGWYVSY